MSDAVIEAQALGFLTKIYDAARGHPILVEEDLDVFCALSDYEGSDTHAAYQYAKDNYERMIALVIQNKRDEYRAKMMEAGLDLPVLKEPNEDV